VTAILAQKGGGGNRTEKVKSATFALNDTRTGMKNFNVSGLADLGEYSLRIRVADPGFDVESETAILLEASTVDPDMVVTVKASTPVSSVVVRSGNDPMSLLPLIGTSK